MNYKKIRKRPQKSKKKPYLPEKIGDREPRFRIVSFTGGIPGSQLCCTQKLGPSTFSKSYQTLISESDPASKHGDQLRIAESLIGCITLPVQKVFFIGRVAGRSEPSHRSVAFRFDRHRRDCGILPRLIVEVRCDRGVLAILTREDKSEKRSKDDCEKWIKRDQKAELIFEMRVRKSKCVGGWVVGGRRAGGEGIWAKAVRPWGSESTYEGLGSR